MSAIEEKLKTYYEYAEYPTDTQEYEQSFDIYLSLRSLLKRQEIDTTDIKILENIVSGYSFRKTAQVLCLDRRTVTARYRRVLGLLENLL